MNILLLGEYSGFFNALAYGLRALNHKVTLAGRTDAFKNYPVDISFEPTFFQKTIPNIFRKAVYRIIKKDIAVIEVYYKFVKHKRFFKNFDVVYLINEQPITQSPFFEKKILNYIFKHNTNVFLSACGDDYQYISFLMSNTLQHHLLQPYLSNKKLKANYRYSLHYLSSSSKKLHEYVVHNVKKIIPADFDYVLAYKNNPKTAPIIPFPVRLHLLAYKPLVIEDKIVIFHGINKVNYYKKGNGYFEKALAIIQKKYAHKIKIITAVSLPYTEYIDKYNSCHILLDQAFAYDQGYNALEAMAKGKVVFTGASSHWSNHYQVEEDSIAIHAIPDAIYLAKKLEWLILHPEKIIEISKNARTFIEHEHDAVQIASTYINTWKQHLSHKQ
jgi:hypothetical protein